MSESKVTISMIAALSRDGIIGLDGEMAWHIPSDFAHFKRITMGKPLVMGRKQFESVGKPLPGRVNIVVSRQLGYQPEGVIVINNFNAAIAHAKGIARAEGSHEIMIIGGGEIYQMGMEIAERLYISHVELEVGVAVGQEKTTFPPIDQHAWKLEREIGVTPKPGDQAAYSIKVYTRNGPVAH